MTPKQLERIGRRIWEDRWKSPLARALGMTYAHVQRYMTGEFEIPRVVELAVLWLEEHRDQARELGLTDRQAEARS
jgi:hypothetical protein